MGFTLKAGSDSPFAVSRKFPTLAIIGHGRCGKDMAGEWLRKHTVLRFEGGCSWAGRHYMADRLTQDNFEAFGPRHNHPLHIWESAQKVLKVTPHDAYLGRHRDRMKWYTYLNEFRKDDPARLIRLVLETSDFVTGIRDRGEYLAARDEGLIDLAVWIYRPGIPVDPTLNIRRSDCEIVIHNDGTPEQYFAKWKILAQALGVLKEDAL